MEPGRTGLRSRKQEEKKSQCNGGESKKDENEAFPHHFSVCSSPLREPATANLLA